MEKIVVPGEFICTEEEFAEGKYSYESDGKLYSTILGKPESSKEYRDVSVKGAKNIRSLRRDDIVYGRVMLVRDNSVGIEMLSAEGSSGERIVIGNSFASIMVRNVSQSFIRNLKAEFKIGDIVTAKVDSIKPYGIDLRTNERDLGVVIGFCSKCRTRLENAGNEFKCIACGSNEHRKIAGAEQIPDDRRERRPVPGRERRPVAGRDRRYTARPKKG